MVLLLLHIAHTAPPRKKGLIGGWDTFITCSGYTSDTTVGADTHCTHGHCCRVDLRLLWTPHCGLIYLFTYLTHTHTFDYIGILYTTQTHTVTGCPTIPRHLHIDLLHTPVTDTFTFLHTFGLDGAHIAGLFTRCVCYVAHIYPCPFTYSCSYSYTLHSVAGCVYTFTTFYTRAVTLPRTLTHYRCPRYPCHLAHIAPCLAFPASCSYHTGCYHTRTPVVGCSDSLGLHTYTPRVAWLRG